MDLIDMIWPADERPQKPKTDIYIHEIKYAGRTWQEKVQLVQTRIKNEGADLYVVTALDEIACLYSDLKMFGLYAKF
jgi:Xaa-Pro aminopeptidase